MTSAFSSVILDKRFSSSKFAQSTGMISFPDSQHERWENSPCMGHLRNKAPPQAWPGIAWFLSVWIIKAVCQYIGDHWITEALRKYEEKKSFKHEGKILDLERRCDSFQI